MSVKVVLGSQWGDEGKGKLVDVFSAEADLVVRFQGGANAGHTVFINGKKHVLHLMPTGILRPSTVCIISNGVVFDPEAFFEELDLLNTYNLNVEGRLFISERTHIIFPYHKYIDKVVEASLDSNKIGTTGRGIGPAYVDKYNRSGIRLVDLFDEDILKSRLQRNIERINKILTNQYQKETVSYQEMLETARGFAKQLKNYVADTTKIMYEAWKRKDNILLEGAQGTLLDIDFGTFPYVTSSNPVSGGAITGTGLPPQALDEVVGVIKAYTTRVGSGPFPTEEENNIGEEIRKYGKEFGATTGRPRRCGWLDGVAAKYAARLNGLTSFAMTKLDVLNDFEEIKFCVGYSYNGKELNTFPASLRALCESKPVYKSFKGWKTDITGCTSYHELPEETKIYIDAIERYTGTPIKYISVGPERDQIIFR